MGGDRELVMEGAPVPHLTGCSWTQVEKEKENIEEGL